MKGYKGMDSDMRCRGMQYEVGKSYHVDGKISVCRNGLHFCERLNDVFKFYERDGNRFFEVEASGTVKTDRRKSAASDLTIIKELTVIEINRIIYGNGIGDGDGNGCGTGYDNGCGYDYGYGFIDGTGYGDGNSCGYGYGDGYGDGTGYGDGNGCYGGYGDGCNGYGSIQRILMFD